MPDETTAKEIAALDAIIAASLAGRSIDDLSDAEILQLCEACPQLSETGKSILENLGTEPFKSRSGHRESNPNRPKAEFAGMYRQGSDEGIVPEVKEEIEKKRGELRARIKQQKNRNV